jgi:hypothetical protein
MRERTEAEKQRETFDGFYKEASEFLRKFENDLGVKIVINFNAYGHCGKAKSANFSAHEELGLYEIAKMDMQTQVHSDILRMSMQDFRRDLQNYLERMGEEEEGDDEE